MNSRPDRLSNIRNEVSDLHPLLEKLLPKLPNVRDIEYTHGPDEMGADFIIAKEHDILKHINYIGVVAKVGKLHQNFSDVERQIDECLTVSRFYRGGKEEIYISEVWVIVTKNITGGAEKKIRGKFKSSKIEFLPGKRLEELIDEFLPVFWTDLSLQVSDYLKTLEERTRELDRSFSLFDIGNTDLYIEQDIYERVDLNYRELRTRKVGRNKKVNIHREIENEKLILIEGGMGSGKSKLLRQLILHYTKPDVFKQTNLLTIFTTFRQLWDDFDANIETLIQSKLSPQIQDSINECKYLILIDGFDEKKSSQDEQLETLERIKTQVLETTNVKAVITSRRVPDIEKAHGINRQIARYDLRPLSLGKTIEFIQALCSEFNIKNRIIEDLKRSPLFRELPRSPIAAILLAKLLNENSEELPSNLTELYSKYSELMLGRWDVKKGLQQSEKEYEALNNVVMRLARYSIDNEIDIISISDAENIFNTYLNERNLELDSANLFEKLVTRSEIIVTDTDRLTLKFKHRTFAEFFYAKSLLNDRDFKIDERAFEFYWMNTYFFYLGIRKDCPDLLESLYNLPLISEAQRWLKVINMGNYFLAAYVSPYKTIEAGIKANMLDAAQLYLDTINSEGKSPFTHLSQMHILWLIQMLTREGYSYKFFEKALESAAIEIASESYDKTKYSQEIIPYALFFLNATYIKLGTYESFDFLLESISEPLPLDISLALRHEADNLPVRTRLMKKQDKRVKKLFKGTQSTSQIINKMYETPIQQLKSKNSQE